VPGAAGKVNVKLPNWLKTVSNPPVVLIRGIMSNASPIAANSPRISDDRPSEPVPGLPLGL
jgi:hypothetical protein